MGKTCKRCGAPVSEGWKACPSCGLKLVVDGRAVVEIILLLIAILGSLGSMYIFWFS